MKPVRELDAGNSHDQFDEGVEETDRARRHADLAADLLERAERAGRGLLDLLLHLLLQPHEDIGAPFWPIRTAPEKK